MSNVEKSTMELIGQNREIGRIDRPTCFTRETFQGADERQARDCTRRSKSGQRTGENLAADLYLPPKGKGPSPLLVGLHGGGWTRGSRDSFAGWGGKLAANGFGLLAIDYTLATAEYRSFPSAIADIAHALRHVAEHAGGHGRRRFAAGVSSAFRRVPIWRRWPPLGGGDPQAGSGRWRRPRQSGKRQGGGGRLWDLRRDGALELVPGPLGRNSPASN